MKEEEKTLFSINYSELEINMVIITDGFMELLNLSHKFKETLSSAEIL